MRNTGLEEAQAGIKIARRNLNNLRYEMTPPLWLQSPSTVILEPRKIKSDTVYPSISHEVMGPDAVIFIF